MLAAKTDDEDCDWACLTQADLEADLAEGEEGVVSALRAGPVCKTLGAENDLRDALKRGNSALDGAAFDAEVFFAAPRALQAISVELQELLVNVDTLSFERAALLASLSNGPLKPPVDSGNCVSEDLMRRVGAELAKPPTKPPPVELDLPSAAHGLDEFKAKLEVFPKVSFLQRTIRLCFGNVDKYQDGKDISRDALFVNGRHLSGSEGGYSAAVEAIVEGLRAGDKDQAWRPEAMERAAQMMLSILNRTSSGFAAFEEVLRIFDCQDAVIVSPDSAAAHPLEAVVIGGSACGRAHTRYAVRQADASGDPFAIIDAHFSFRVPTDTLRTLAECQIDSSRKWPSKDLEGAILLRWSPHNTDAVDLQ